MPTTDSSVSHIKISQAGLISAVTFIIGQIVAFVPAFGPDKQALISAGTAVISAVFLVANAIHALASSNVSARDVEHAAINAGRGAVQDALTHVDLNSLAQQAVNAQSLPDLEALAKKEVQRALSGLSLQFATGQPQAQVQPEPAVIPPASPGPPPTQ